MNTEEERLQYASLFSFAFFCLYLCLCAHSEGFIFCLAVLLVTAGKRTMATTPRTKCSQMLWCFAQGRSKSPVSWFPVIKGGKKSPFYKEKTTKHFFETPSALIRWKSSAMINLHNTSVGKKKKKKFKFDCALVEIQTHTRWVIR